MTGPTDDDPEIAELEIEIPGLDEAALDDRPFGIIKLDRTGKVRAYNLYEERLARRRREDVLGKSFFFEVAPCTRLRQFYGRFQDGVEQRYLRATFGFVFRFPHGDRSVRVSMFYERADDSVWVIVRG